MKELSPKMKKIIEDFTNTIRKFSGKDVLDSMLGGITAKLRMLPLISSILKYVKMNLGEFAERFSDPFLKKVIPTIQYDIQEEPTLVPIVFLSMLSVGDAGWQIGGSAALSHNIESATLN